MLFWTSDPVCIVKSMKIRAKLICKNGLTCLLPISAGLAKSGMLGICWQLLTLTAAVLPVLLPRTAAGSEVLVTHLLVGGLVLS